MSETYIYGIWDLGIQKFDYVGKSNEPQERFKGHMKCSDNEDLRELVEEKGVDSFGLIILERTNFFKSRDWVKREKFWVKKFRKEGHPLCNKNDGGGGVTKHTEETKVKMSKAKSGENNPCYGRIGKKHPLYGVSPTKETRAEIGKSLLGENSPLYGKHPSNETRAKQSKAKMGKNNPSYGKPCSKKTKARIGKANAKPYPAFFNEKSGKFLSAGINLAKMCREQGLNQINMFNLKKGATKQTIDGWRLAEE